MLYLLNGPPRSGKDTVAQTLREMLPGQSRHVKLSQELKQRTHAMYGLADRPAQYFEDVKDQPHEEFLGLTPRQAYIEAHERYWKPVHGEAILGELLAQRIKASGLDPHYIVSDAGDRPQTLPLLRQVGAENTVLIRIERDGCEWDNRRWFDLPEALATLTIPNNGTLAELRECITIIFR